jgi:hypothetical protein
MQALGRHVRLVQLWSHAAERAHAHQVHTRRISYSPPGQLMKERQTHRADRTTRQPSGHSGHGGKPRKRSTVRLLPHALLGSDDA